MVAPSLKVSPVPYPSSCSDELKAEQFGVVVSGVADINNITENEFSQQVSFFPLHDDLIEQLLYTHSILLFENASDLTPAGQWALTNKFDPAAGEYGHGKGDGRPALKSILHPDLRTIPGTPVQLIGNGPVYDPSILQGLPEGTRLKHASHQSFHKSTLTDEESAAGYTRFYRWHIDAALYKLDPPKVTTLFGITVPTGPKQIVRYDDGTGDELEVPIGGTAFVSTKVMFDILPKPLKSLAVRCKVQYSPHPYVFMTPAKSNSTGLGIVSEGKEMPRDQLPPWEEEHIKVYPMTWKNPVTGALHFQVHPSGIETLLIDPLPAGAKVTADTLYPNGAHLTDLEEVRDLVYKMQRPGIAPGLVYTVDWKPYDLALFHNRGTLHTITGAFQPDEQRASWQCNLASTDSPLGPDGDDLAKYA